MALSHAEELLALMLRSERIPHVAGNTGSTRHASGDWTSPSPTASSRWRSKGSPAQADGTNASPGS